MSRQCCSRPAVRFGLLCPRIGVRGFPGKFYSKIGRALPKGLRKSINFAAMEPKESPILQGLNPAQLAAVVNYDSPSLIIAGAGSGKTRVLTARIAYMIEQGVAPFNILALTFTNKAAQQMRERIAQMIPDNRSRYIRMGTFHSVFSRILRENAEKIGFPESFTIYEPSDCKNLIKTIVRELNLADEKYKPNLIASRISYAKNCLVTPGAYLANSVYAAEDRQAQIPEFGNVYNIYCQRCQRNGAMDFDDLLLQTNILLRDAPDVLARYQELFKYILVDEYQDTNYAQYVIIRRLSQLHSRVCVALSARVTRRFRLFMVWGLPVKSSAPISRARSSIPASAEAVAMAQMFHTAFSRCKISSTEKPSGPDRVRLRTTAPIRLS